jgi:hypothetical protein
MTIGEIEKRATATNSTYIESGGEADMAHTSF